MGFFLFCWVLSYFLVVRPAVDTVHAVKGTTPPRVQLANARMALKGTDSRPGQPARYGLGDYLRDWWHDSLEDARDLRTHRRALRMNGQRVGWRESLRQLGSTMAREWRSLTARPEVFSAPETPELDAPPVDPTAPVVTEPETTPPVDARDAKRKADWDHAIRTGYRCSWRDTPEADPCGVPTVSGSPYCPFHVQAWQRREERAAGAADVPSATAPDPEAAATEPPQDNSPADTTAREQEVCTTKPGTDCAECIIRDGTSVCRYATDETPTGPVADTTPPRLATVTPIRFTRGDNTMPETTIESTVSGEIDSLRAAITYATDQATACDECVSSVDQSLAELANHGVTDEDVLGAFARAQEGIGAVADEFRAAQVALEAHLAVTDAYEANKGAGEKTFVTGE